jgi:hypothetical protein
MPIRRQLSAAAELSEQLCGVSATDAVRLLEGALDQIQRLLAELPAAGPIPLASSQQPRDTVSHDVAEHPAHALHGSRYDEVAAA